VILDEIGRGTSTLDGLSLAWAITESLAQRGTRTLFATHYHELTALADRSDAIGNLHVAVREWKDRIVFLHHIEPGSTDRSYGLHVAQLAGVPAAVVERANLLLETLSVQTTVDTTAAPPPVAPPQQFGLFAEPSEPHPTLERLRALDIHSMSPMDSFDELRRLIDQANET
ncbi:MAG TPA: DNA mismatch repair protein MutS, partial [Phycisphaerales bacterium]|nr:DNA mismatch repair protein MutS [Phycisphaerales bacterium]